VVTSEASTSGSMADAVDESQGWPSTTRTGKGKMSSGWPTARWAVGWIVVASVLCTAVAESAEDDTVEGGTPIYDLAHHQWGTPEINTSTSLLIFCLFLLLCLIISYQITHVYKCTLIPEAAVTLFIGGAAGGIAMLADRGRGKVSGDLVDFSPFLFFVGLLPPIIFSSGYSVHKNHFFANFGAVSAFALCGTLFSAVFVGVLLYGLARAGALAPHQLDLAECLTFGALISATDPVSVLAVFAELKVDPNLFYLVFGESVLNDAVGVVLFNTFAKFVGYSHSIETAFIAIADFVIIFLGSLFIGFLMGCFAALASKRIDFHEHVVVELACYFLLIYLPYLVAEALEMSGIVSTLFAGIFTKHYAHLNLSPASQDKIQIFIKMFAFLTETAVFLYLGLSIFRLHFLKHYYSSLNLWAIILCLVARALHIYPLSYLLNRWRRDVDRPIDRNKQHMLWFSGLRGAVAFACAQVFPDKNGNRDAMLVTTMTIVLITVLTMGSATVPMLRLLKINIGVDEDSFEPAPPSACTQSILSFDRRVLMPRLVSTRDSNGNYAITSTTSVDEDAFGGVELEGNFLRDTPQLAQGSFLSSQGDRGADGRNLLPHLNHHHCASTAPSLSTHTPPPLSTLLVTHMPRWSAYLQHHPTNH